jgi:periplasmic protein TonB
MTAAPVDIAGPQLFSSVFSGQTGYRTRREAFLIALVGQSVLVALLGYVTCCIVANPPALVSQLHKFDELPLIFSGHGGGGGGDFDKVPASMGNLPSASLDIRLAPPTVIQTKEMPKLAVPETVRVAPDVTLPQGGQIGDPMSQFTKMLSNGPGGRGGIGNGCCGGVGPSQGPGFGTGPQGIYPAGRMGVTVPQVIFSPEPDFSDEARKARTQGVVQLLLVVGKDGHTYDIRVAQSLGMGLDEQAMDAVRKWRFRPATLNGQPVATQIAVQVEFHLY